MPDSRRPRWIAALVMLTCAAWLSACSRHTKHEVADVQASGATLQDNGTFRNYDGQPIAW